MKKIGQQFSFILISIVGISCSLTSIWLLTTPAKVNATAPSECRLTCPDGKPLSCKGAKVRSISDEADPGCICDSKEFRCSNNNTNDVNKNKKNKKKESNTNERNSTEENQ